MFMEELMPPVKHDSQQTDDLQSRLDREALQRFGRWWESLFAETAKEETVEEETVSGDDDVQDAS